MSPTFGSYRFSYHFTHKGAMEVATEKARMSGGRYLVRRNYNTKYPRSKWIVTPAESPRRSAL